MRRTERFFSRIPDWAILIFFSALLVTQTTLSLREKSATYDETAHLPAGYLHLKFGDYAFNQLHSYFGLRIFENSFTQVAYPSF